jgi:hypothetical protein
VWRIPISSALIFFDIPIAQQIAEKHMKPKEILDGYRQRKAEHGLKRHLWILGWPPEERLPGLDRGKYIVKRGSCLEVRNIPRNGGPPLSSRFK